MSPEYQSAHTLTLTGVSAMTIYHKHHILPRHAGGTDDPTNLIKLTIEEHAEAHRILYEEHGRWQDYVAWKALSNSIPKAEIIKLKQSLATKGKKQSKEHIEKRKMIGEKNPMFGKCGELNPMFGKKGELSPHFGKKHTKETCKKKSNALKDKSLEDLHGKEKADEIRKKLQKPKTEEHKAKLKKPKPKVVCRIHDRKEMSIGNFMNWYKNAK
jgi:hypothetical protein